MAENTYKKPPFQTESKRPGGLFRWIDKLLNLDFLLDEKHRKNVVPYLLFSALLAIVYIANRHYAERSQHRLMQLRREVNNLRTEYTTRKADYMSLTRQSVVKQKAQKLGLESGHKPPYVIRLDD
jgi:hypothetical protein